MDQVSLPFVLNMDSTNTTQDDEDAHTSCTNDAFHKRKISTHIFCNADEGDSRDGYTTLVCKGSPKGRHKPTEKLAYDSRVPMHFQKNALVDTVTMIELEKEFILHTKDRHNGLCCLLLCNNLNAHIVDEV